MPEGLNKRVTKLEEKIRNLERGDTPGQQTIQPDTKKHDSDKKSNSTEINPVIASQSAPSADNTKDPKQSWYSRIPWWKVLEGLGVVSVIVYAWITYQQWRDLRRNFTIDERAWLEIRPIAEQQHDPLSQFMSPVIPSQLMNIGKTPAREVQVLTNAEVIPREQAPSFTYTTGTQTRIDVSLAFPNSPHPVDIGSAIPLTTSQREDLESGKAYIAAYAEVQWKDIFGNPHWLHFCVRHTFTAGYSNARTCTEYNDTDAK